MHNQKRFIRVLAAFVALVLIALVVVIRERRDRVTFWLTNETNEVVRSVQVNGFGLTPAVTVTGPLLPRQAVAIKLGAAGYSGYSITITFASGRTFTTDEREALRGYCITERIQTSDSIFEWDPLSTIYERSFQSQYGWFFRPFY